MSAVSNPCQGKREQTPFVSHPSPGRAVTVVLHAARVNKAGKDLRAYSVAALHQSVVQQQLPEANTPPSEEGGVNGGAEGSRTPDPQNAILVLSQLSYNPRALAIYSGFWMLARKFEG